MTISKIYFCVLFNVLIWWFGSFPAKTRGCENLKFSSEKRWEVSSAEFYSSISQLSSCWSPCSSFGVAVEFKQALFIIKSTASTASPPVSNCTLFLFTISKTLTSLSFLQNLFANSFLNKKNTKLKQISPSMRNFQGISIY